MTVATTIAAGVCTIKPQSVWALAPQDNLQWNDAKDWGVEGKGFSNTENFYDRLPANAKGVVRDAVWNLSRHSAGLSVQFKTDATTIHVDHKVTSKTLAMPHMPATGVSGLDLYAKDEQGDWRWVSVTKPTTQLTKTAIVQNLKPGFREYRIYLPLYNGTEHLKIGVGTDCKFEPVEPRQEKPIVFYGTSITHGACASRPGMPHPAILGRRLNRPIINLGFSGNGKLEKEVGEFLVKLDPAVYVLDCLPNMNSREVAERTKPMIAQLRATHPEVPIVMVEDRIYANSWIMPAREKKNKSNRDAFRFAYQTMLDEGVRNLYFVNGETLLAANSDDTTDGSHPSDLGFFNQANALEPTLREALGRKTN